MSISRKLMYVTTMAACLAVMMSACSLASQDGPPKRYTETITTQAGEKVSFEMVLIPAGSFLMGSPESQAGRGNDEGPQHNVCLDPFYLCTTETTLELFLAYYHETVSAKKDFLEVEQAKKDTAQAGSDVDAITGPTPVYGDLTLGYGRQHPAMGATWHNAMTFCRWLSKKTGKEYRLPTEAEWEYASRAGTTSVFGFTDDPAQLGDYAWYKANSGAEGHDVAKKKPNSWGLYDMLGNVREWVYDFYSRYTSGSAEQANPKGPKTGKVHVARGGDFDSPAEELRCSARAFEQEWWRSGDPQIPKSKWWLPEMGFIGFRVACSVDASAHQSGK